MENKDVGKKKCVKRERPLKVFNGSEKTGNDKKGSSLRSIFSLCFNAFYTILQMLFLIFLNLCPNNLFVKTIGFILFLTEHFAVHSNYLVSKRIFIKLRLKSLF